MAPRKNGQPHQIRLTITPVLEPGYARWSLHTIRWSSGGTIPTATPVDGGLVMVSDPTDEEELLSALLSVLSDLAAAMR